MDLLAACRVFVHVGEQGSFTLGASAARVPQSVASRRVAALETHFGERLFDRTGRRTTLTPFGRGMLAPARRLVELAEAVEANAERVRWRPMTLAVPATCATRDLAGLEAAGRKHGLGLEFRLAQPAERAELSRTGDARAAVAAVPTDVARWVVPLGVGTLHGPSRGRFHFSSLRPRRGTRAAPTLWLHPEDDVGHVRGPLERAGHAAGLRPTQVSVGGTLTACVASVLAGRDLLVCSAPEAEGLNLYWQAFALDLPARGLRLIAGSADDLTRLEEALGEELARALGEAHLRR